MDPQASQYEVEVRVQDSGENEEVKQTVQARMTELHRITQDPGQPVQNFLSNLKSKARQCDMNLVYSKADCKTINFYNMTSQLR